MLLCLDRTVLALLGVLALATAVSPKAIVFGIPAIVVWVTKLIVRGRAVRHLPLTAPMLALLFSVALASSFAYDPIASWTRVRMFAALLLAVMIGETCTNLQRLKALTSLLLVSALIAVAWSFWQRHFGSGAIALAHATSIRAKGFYQSYIPFSELLTLIGALSWGLFLTARNRRRWLLGGVFSILVACLLTTVTRSAAAALAFACLLALWQLPGRRIRALTLVLAAVVMVLGIMWVRRTRGAESFALSDVSTQYRLTIWHDGLRLIARHPLLGVGFDNVVRHPDHWHLQAYGPLYQLKSHFHSTPIEYAVDGGLLTLSAWFWLLGAYFVLLRRTARAAIERPFARGLTLGIYAGFVAFNVMSLVQYIGGDSDVMTVFWFLMGLAIALSQALQQEQMDPKIDRLDNWTSSQPRTALLEPTAGLSGHPCALKLFGGVSSVQSGFCLTTRVVLRTLSRFRGLETSV